MAEEIKINMKVFHDNIEALKSSATGLNSNMIQERTFKTTNIHPFTDDLENTLKTLKLLVEDYYDLLNKDIAAMRNAGESLQQTDEKLAKDNSSNGTQMNKGD